MPTFCFSFFIPHFCGLITRPERVNSIRCYLRPPVIERRPEEVGEKCQPPPEQLPPLSVREVLLLAVETEAGAVHGEGEEEGGPGGRATDRQGGQVGQGLEEVEQLGNSPDSL